MKYSQSRSKPSASAAATLLSVLQPFSPSSAPEIVTRSSTIHQAPAPAPAPFTPSSVVPEIGTRVRGEFSFVNGEHVKAWFDGTIVRIEGRRTTTDVQKKYVVNWIGGEQDTYNKKTILRLMKNWTKDVSSLTPWPQKLMDMLTEEKENECIVAWLPEGNAFTIKDLKRFVSDILPRYFGEDATMKKLGCQLSNHGFHSAGTGGGNTGGPYKHNLFLRDQPELCSQIKSINRTRKKSPKENAPLIDHDLASSEIALSVPQDPIPPRPSTPAPLPQPQSPSASKPDEFPDQVSPDVATAKTTIDNLVSSTTATTVENKALKAFASSQALEIKKLRLEIQDQSTILRSQNEEIKNRLDFSTRQNELLKISESSCRSLLDVIERQKPDNNSSSHKETDDDNMDDVDLYFSNEEAKLNKKKKEEKRSRKKART
ncbi:hypothetical protein TL16_g03409 [Triparma laevis f. inornata]|uniref:HSF-type DNA-binding domain-containing protein n=1 Tax=Triparma laevis f. inornata TaxID=1714386 RepID=A0A9W7A6A3_9STRA|nr:hypothetical protein TL16_g03409 [Triparma laevis f. inornata]